MHEVFTGDILTDFPFIEPIHQAIVRRLRSAGISGTTTYRGFWASTVTGRCTGIVSCSSNAVYPRSRP
jgi:hypothetical protein